MLLQRRSCAADERNAACAFGSLPMPHTQHTPAWRCAGQCIAHHVQGVRVVVPVAQVALSAYAPDPWDSDHSDGSAGVDGSGSSSSGEEEEGSDVFDSEGSSEEGGSEDEVCGGLGIEMGEEWGSAHALLVQCGLNLTAGRRSRLLQRPCPCRSLGMGCDS